MPYLSQLQDGRVLLSVYVQPRASRNALVCIHDQAVKLAITSPPVDDAANRAIIVFFASFFGVARQDIVLHRGQQSRRKQIIITGVGAEVIRERIMVEMDGREGSRKSP